MRLYKQRILLTTLASAGMAIAGAHAQNPNFALGDLVLFFQNPGGATGAGNTIMVNLGAGTTFRDATNNMINLININALLSDTTNGFGANWWEAGSLHFGIAGVRSNSAGSTVVTNGDPTRTLYVSRARDVVGTAGVSGSSAWEVLGDTDMTTGANGIINLHNVLEVNFNSATASSPTGQSRVDDQNPFTATSPTYVQGTAFGIFPGGVQDQFGPGTFGTIGGINAEAALDLYRILARTDLAGTVSDGTTPARTGTYEGTIVIDQSGNVSYLAAVPEPSAAAMLGAAAGLLGFSRRRRSIA